MFARAKEAAGLPDIWFHDLRRSFITNARRHGVAESVVMRMSGHRTRSVFERYNIISAEDLLEAARSLDSARCGARGLGQSLDKVENEGSSK
jgi:integrase